MSQIILSRSGEDGPVRESRVDLRVIHGEEGMVAAIEAKMYNCNNRMEWVLESQ